MTTTELLAKFADPDIIQTLSVSDKLMAGLVATILGMGITFSALIILQFVMVLMEKVLSKPADLTSQPLQPQSKPDPSPEIAETTDNELIAVITTVLAQQLKTSVSNIVIRNIEKVETRSPVWNTAGIVEQMDSRL